MGGKSVCVSAGFVARSVGVCDGKVVVASCDDCSGLTDVSIGLLHAFITMSMVLVRCGPICEAVSDRSLSSRFVSSLGGPGYCVV